MQKGYLPSNFTKCIENCGIPDFCTDYQICHLSNPSGLPEMLLKIDPWGECDNLTGSHLISGLMTVTCSNLNEESRVSRVPTLATHGVA